MLSYGVLIEYGVQTNEMYACSDSGKPTASLGMVIVSSPLER